MRATLANLLELKMNVMEMMFAFGMQVHVVTAIVTMAMGRRYASTRAAPGMATLVSDLSRHAVFLHMKNIRKKSQMNVKVNIIHALEEIDGDESVKCMKCNWCTNVELCNGHLELKFRDF